MIGKIKVSLSRELRKKYGVRSFPVAVGDIIRVTSGKRHGEGGKVIEVNHTNGLVSVEGVTIAKEDGKQKALFLRPEDMTITRLDFSRDERIQKLREIAAIKQITFQEPAPEELSPVPAEEAPAEVEAEAEEVEESDTLESEEPEAAEAEAAEAEPEEVEEEKSESEEKDDQ